MKNVYHAMRPAWAALEQWENTMSIVAGVALGLFAAQGRDYFTHLAGLPKDGTLTEYLWTFLAIVATTVGCRLLIRYYRSHGIGCYPSTFFYCFDMPSNSNPRGKSEVIGFCHLRPDMRDGKLIAEGASFFWENDELQIDSRVGFRSTQVFGTKNDKDITTCYIRYTIEQEDSSKRNYHHGILRFRLVNGESPNKSNKDVYAGHLRSMQKDFEIPDVDVHSKGYAEWYSKGDLEEDRICRALGGEAPGLLLKLKQMRKYRPWPTLWQEAESEVIVTKTNFWRLQIPTPQTIIQNKTVYPYVERYLNKALSLVGLNDEAVGQFKRLALQKAREDDTTVAYEYSLKNGLNSRLSRDREKALLDRANIVYKQISPYLSGDSLLDIGCGNGLISHLARAHFQKKIQLLDVVSQVMPTLDLPFLPYNEGDPLPVANNSFDTVLLIAVLHHSADPEKLLKLAWGAARKRLIIIESVVGVHDVPQPATYELAKCSDADQIAYAAFIDWFYNRVLHDGVSVPYNFTTPEDWRITFMKHEMPLIKTDHFGQDMDIGPEYHILFVLEKPSRELPDHP
jgi:ubiquinone/menaquinone biosynthesis C-methylase UbiE